MTSDIQAYLKTNPHLYEPDLLKRIDLLYRWLDFDHSKKLTLAPADMIQIAKRITLPPKRPFLKNFLPNWKLRLIRFFSGHRMLQSHIPYIV